MMDFGDVGEEGEEVVRSFMLTKGRTRTSAEELAIETIVTASPTGRLNAKGMSPDHRKILEAATSPISVVELSARLTIPLRAALVMTSEMVASGALNAESLVDEIDASFLSKIRTAFGAL